MSRLNDPLLLFAKTGMGIVLAILGFCTGLLILVAVVFPLSLWILPRDRWPDGMQDATPIEVVGFGGAILLMAALVALGFFVVRNLWKIVKSVEEGDPFIPVNASRLRNMAFALLAVYPVGFAMLGAMFWLESRLVGKNDDMSITFEGFDLGILAMVIVLLILARVFRQGAAMREDLEGTV